VAAVRHVEGVVAVQDRLTYSGRHQHDRYRPHPVVSS